MKIWAKLQKGDKILRDLIFDEDIPLTPATYMAALQEISYRLDTAVPVSLDIHFRHFERFNRVKYLPRDFVEEVDFDNMVLERVVEHKKPQNYYV